MKARIGYSLVILIGIAGMVLTLIWTIKATDYVPLMTPIGILSMVITIIGILGIGEGRRPE